jgi:hypothetical protein
MTIDKRFALLATNGDVLYPYQKSERQGERRFGFVVSAPGKKDAKGEGYYTTDLAEVIRRVVQDGWNVRAKEDAHPGRRAREGGYGIGKRAIGEIWVAQELASLVEGASLPVQRGSHPRSLRLSHVGEVDAGAQVPLHQVEALRTQDYALALDKLADQLSPSQKRMLIGHARALQGRLSMEAIAREGGYDAFRAGNSQYGAMAAKFAAHFGVSGLPNQTMALAHDTRETDSAGHSVWQIRPALVAALADKRWMPEASDAELLLQGADVELAQDPIFQNAQPTTRRALIEARVGQGKYRRDLLHIWDHACALTGSPIQEVLIASHAKAWADCKTAEARLDPYNGLLLAASVDKLFDRGLIAFDATGRLLVKPWITVDHLQALGIPHNARLRFVKPEHLSYLAAHRAEHHFAD